MLSNSDGGNLIAQAFGAVVLAEGASDVLWEYPRMLNYLCDLVPSERDRIEQIRHIYSTNAAKHIKNAATDPNSAESEMRQAFRTLRDAGISEKSINSSMEYFVSAVPSLSEAYVSLLKWQYGKNADSTVKYIEIQLSLRNWGRAKELCDDTIKQYPGRSEPYLFRLMAKYQLSDEADLIDTELDLKGSPDFQNAVRCASGERQEKLVQYQDVQGQRIEKNHSIAEGLKLCRKEQDFLALASECDSILSFRNTSQLREACMAGVEVCKTLASARECQAIQKWTEAAELFCKVLSDKRFGKLAAGCGNPASYLKAVGLMARAQSERAFLEAAAAFEAAGGFGDSEIKRQQCIKQAENSKREQLYQQAREKIAKAQGTGFFSWRKHR